VSSPFNFIDPAAGAYYTGKVTGATSVAPRFEPDRAVTFTPGPRTSLLALADLGSVLTRDSHIGWPLLLLMVAGMIAAPRIPEARPLTLLVTVPCLLFAAAASIVFPFHVAPRHATAFLALVCTLVWPGARLLASFVTSLSATRSTVAAVAVVAACVTPAVATFVADREMSRLDSRVAAQRWLLTGIPHDARLLLDDYGPVLNPSPAAIARLSERLTMLPPGPFITHQAERLALQRAYPPADGFNIDELGHQWWLPAEKSDEALRSTAADLDMGSPLVSRVPQRLDTYRQQGFRYVVTNSDGEGRYKRWPDRFPSFARFYAELSALTPVKVFDPTTWHGKGPIVSVYDLAAPSALQVRSGAAR
jgi:hypothetical protein